jgi:hypothetical protein
MGEWLPWNPTTNPNPEQIKMTTATAAASKPRRVREVLDTGMVAHLWANRSQDCARNGRNFYFDGPSIYSYGRHFEIARHVERRGRRAILFTVRTYSNTTAKHICEVRGAIRGHDVPVFSVANMGESPGEVRGNWRSYLERIATAQDELKRARAAWRIELLSGTVSRLIREANAYADFYGLRFKRLVPDSSTIQDIAARLEKAEKEDRARVRAAEKRREEETARRGAEMLENLEKWVAGDDVRIYWVHGFDTPTRLRVRGDVIETSRGAAFPLEHGIKAFPFILNNRERAAEYIRNGHTIHLGHFAIDRIDPDGTVKAGCHTVAWSEIERIARQLGLIS